MFTCCARAFGDHRTSKAAYPATQMVPWRVVRHIIDLLLANTLACRSPLGGRTTPSAGFDVISPLSATTNEILLPTGPWPDLARRRQAARKNPPSPVASVHSLLVWPSRSEHGRNPRFPNTPRVGRRAGGTASSCSNRFRVRPLAFPATRHDAAVCTPRDVLASLAAQNKRVS